MRRFVVLCAVSCLSLTLIGCTGGGAPSVPATPDGTVKTVAQSLADKQPGVIWGALPDGYRKDITDILRTFAEKMDKDVYDKGFAVFGKIVDVLRQKKDFVLGSAMAKQAPAKIEDIKKHYDALVDFFATLLGSEIKNLDSLKTLDVGAFLSETGSKLMEKASEISKMSAKDEMGSKLGKLAKIKVETVSSSDTEAKLKITLPEEKPQEFELVKVEGKWVPKDMAQDWKKQVAEAKASVEKLDLSKSKAQIMMMLGGLDGALDGLLGAKTQDEFNKLLQQAMGQLMGAIMATGASNRVPPK